MVEQDMALMAHLMRRRRIWSELRGIGGRGPPKDMRLPWRSSSVLKTSRNSKWT